MTSVIRATFCNLGIVVLSMLFTLAMGELAFRTFGLGTRPPETHKLLTQYDPTLGWSKIPKRTITRTTSEYTVVERINSLGIRGPEYSTEKYPNELRVVVLGDSFAEGYSVNFEDLFSEIMKNELNHSSNTPHNVINMGTGGYSTDQELILFMNQGKYYNPDLTVLLFYYNDVWYNQSQSYWRGYKPLFVSEEGGLKLTNVPVPLPAPTSALRTAKEWLGYNSHLYSTLVEVIDSYRILRTMLAYLGLASESRSEFLKLSKEFKIFRQSDDPKIENAWRVTELLLSRLKSETSSIGSKFIVLYVPPRFAIYGEEWKSTMKRHRLMGEVWDVDRPATILAKICARIGILLIDPTKAFRMKAGELAARGERLYYERDRHWNSNGHKLAGEILARVVRQLQEEGSSNVGRLGQVDGDAQTMTLPGLSLR